MSSLAKIHHNIPYTVIYNISFQSIVIQICFYSAQFVNGTIDNNLNNITLHALISQLDFASLIRITAMHVFTDILLKCDALLT